VRQRLKGNFFTVDLGLVRAGFQQVPGARATCRSATVWPCRSKSIARSRWGDGRLLNTGELYTANLAEAEDGPLPHFAGPPGSESQC
jgi:hypothetical protein